LDGIRPYYRNRILDAVGTHLRYTPMQESRSGIKQLRLLDSPAYRLRVGGYRIFYDVDEPAAVVTVLRVLSKKAGLAYLAAERVENGR
jgi:mRNA-degrading endonuclease RelE of RelBE toxin-antitoxin system